VLPWPDSLSALRKILLRRDQVPEYTKTFIFFDAMLKVVTFTSGAEFSRDNNSVQ
jgi:hypothetical protein